MNNLLKKKKESRRIAPKNPEPFFKKIDNYRLMTEIGKGAYGKVYLTLDEYDNKYATKVIEKKSILDANMSNFLKKEIDIMKSLDHPNIVRLFSQIETQNNVYLVLEFCNGFGLNKLVRNFKSSKLTWQEKEKQVQHICQQLFGALMYLSENNVLHRDLKLENILLHFENDQDKANMNVLNSTVKIIDFGFSRTLDKGQVAMTICGSPLNMAPQLLYQIGKYDDITAYDERADLWSAGTLLFELVTGNPPFSANDVEHLKGIVDKGNYKLPQSQISEECVSLLSGLLQSNPENRLSLEEVLNHPFLNFEVQKLKLVDWKKAKTNVLRIDENGLKTIYGESYFKIDQEKENKNVEFHINNFDICIEKSRDFPQMNKNKIVEEKKEEKIINNVITNEINIDLIQKNNSRDFIEQITKKGELVEVSQLIRNEFSSGTNFEIINIKSSEKEKVEDSSLLYKESCFDDINKENSEHSDLGFSTYLKDENQGNNFNEDEEMFSNFFCKK